MSVAGVWSRCWLLFLCWGLAAGLQAQPAGPPATPPTLVLPDDGAAMRDPVAGLEWIDKGGNAGLPQVLAGQARFETLQPDRIRSLGRTDALWIRLRLARPAGSRTQWIAEMPLPPLDEVTLYQQDADGAWQGQRAGDRLPVAAWPEPARFPVFRLDVPAGEARDVYFRVRHNARSSIPLRISTASNHRQRMETAYLGIGLVFGGLLLMIAACFAQSWVYRDKVFFGYAAYATLIALAMAAYTGAGSHLLWPHWAWFADFSQGGLAILSAAAAILFVRDLTGVAKQARRLALLARLTVFAAPLLMLEYALIDRPPATIVLGTYLAWACLLNLLMAWSSWRGGDKVSLWVLAAYLPLGLAVVLTMLRVFGLVAASWANQYGLVAAMALQVPLLLVALSLHSRERHGAITRELALSSQDALTGLLAAHLFHDRLRQCVARNRRDREGAAVLFVDLANYPRIREQHGSAIAEQSLLRSVIRLRALLRESDTLSRIGEARFGIILERKASRVTVTDRAARVVSAGMMPLKRQKAEVSLDFHIAVAMLNELDLDAQQLAQALADLLDSMSAKTRRPIRFVGHARPQPGLQPDSVSPADDSGMPLPGGPASA